MMTTFQEAFGYTLLVIVSISTTYFFVWIYGVPFIPSDSVLLVGFPALIYGLLMPLSIFMFMTILLAAYATVVISIETLSDKRIL
uniref:Dolichol phosphate-mannose biosynthesis regulatory protein n=1 Tax=Acrobeloides nanus TaxID=290746 RepID=A0A914CVT1_9BILA